MSTEPIPPLLTVQHRGFGPAQAYRLLSGTVLTPIGPALPPGLETSPINTATVNARAIVFKNRIYATQGDRVYRLDEGTDPTVGDNAWTEVHQLTSMNSNRNYDKKTGIFVINISLTPTLTIGYQSTSGSFRIATSTDGATWSDTVDIGPAITTSMSIGRSIVYNNRIYWIIAPGTATDHILELDPSTDTAISLDVPSWVGSTNTGDMCVFDNRLWVVGWNHSAADTSASLNELSGGAFVLRHTLDNGSGLPDNSGSSHLGGPCLFTNGTNMYCIINGDDASNNRGNFCFNYSLTAGSGSLLNQSDISAIVLPPALRPPATPASQTFIWHAYQDNATDPEYPCIHLWVLDTDDTSSGFFTYYRWNGPNTQIGIPPGTGSLGPAAGLALPNTKNGGGERIWSPGQAKIEITNVSPETNGQLISFQAFGDLTPTYEVRFYYDETDAVATNPVTLKIGSSSGGIIGEDSFGSFISGIAADGITIYTAIWDTTADNISQFQTIILMPTIKEE